MPKVTVWGNAMTASDTVRDQIAASLRGLVGESQIVVLDD